MVTGENSSWFLTNYINIRVYIDLF
jgi:hypothetical protein